MKLFHFTCNAHWPSILQQGLLRPTESNIHMRHPHYGPDVVWLTTCPESHQPWMHSLSVDLVLGVRARTPGDYIDKGRIRLLVEVETAHHWPRWSREHGIKKRWYRALAHTGGDPLTWYVSETPVYTRDWLEAVDTRTGEIICTSLDLV